ncbi:uncharacterized protein PHALS_11685 [Plasmopara halstedii]|uniref:Uncharacterized protein n=1 Tax=Plasmopara halstedii TaxID=4781 RepID=A0A0P1AKG5_PLAHL|nr:uncharacterized protein PHALS_11685 [Plasmopara halstedii]CEG41334.1 hypothetical protein PHALS_11685 [Plasmopara halstedii]|eukprot:XP_024577703.1 hypothetical protein PHALS_11685 [Plasmopara halstedii]
MSASVSANEAVTAMRKVKLRSQSKVASTSSGFTHQRVLRDTNKRPRVCEMKTQHKKKTETAVRCGTTVSFPAHATYGCDQWSGGDQIPAKAAEVGIEDKGGGVFPERNVTEEITKIGLRNEQLRHSVAALKRKFSLCEEETQQLLLGLGALNAVANELASLQMDYQERSSKNAALIQNSLEQLSSCSAQVDMLNRCREVTAAQLEAFRHECTDEMNKLVVRLGYLADSAMHEPESVHGHDVNIVGKRQQIKLLKDELCEYRARVSHDGSVTSIPCSAVPAQLESTERINLALTQLGELHAEMYQLKQVLVQENHYFRQDLGNLVSQQLACIREAQESEAERINEELDLMRSGMCGVLKDIHRLKERTKYLVPSMARVGPRSNLSGLPLNNHRLYKGRGGEQVNEERMKSPNAIFQSSGYSLTMASRQCRDDLPHYEHGYDDDCYCPGVTYLQTGVCHARPRCSHSSKSSNSSPGHSDDDNWRMLHSEDVCASDQRPAQPCESPHYSACSSSLSGRLSFNGDEHSIPSAQQFEQQLLEQHRLFWIGEGAGNWDLTSKPFEESKEPAAKAKDSIRELESHASSRSLN